MTEFQLKKSRLRPWKQGDELPLIRYANNKKIWQNVRDHFPYPYTLPDAHRWTFHASTALIDKVFAIEVNGEPVGSIGLVPKEDVYRTSMEIGYWLGEEFWGKGIVSEAVRAITKYGFNHFDIVRIYADIFEWNPASARVLEKNDYVFEARLKNAIIKDERIGDVLIYSILKENCTV